MSLITSKLTPKVWLTICEDEARGSCLEEPLPARDEIVEVPVEQVA
jgi:hypothetical protein